MTQTEQKEEKSIELPHDSILFNGEPIDSICINFDVEGYQHKDWDFLNQKPNPEQGQGKLQKFITVNTSGEGHTNVATEHNYGTPLQHDTLNWGSNGDYKEGNPDF